MFFVIPKCVTISKLCIHITAQISRKNLAASRSRRFTIFRLNQNDENYGARCYCEIERTDRATRVSEDLRVPEGNEKKKGEK